MRELAPLGLLLKTPPMYIERYIWMRWQAQWRHYDASFLSTPSPLLKCVGWASPARDALLKLCVLGARGGDERDSNVRRMRMASFRPRDTAPQTEFRSLRLFPTLNFDEGRVVLQCNAAGHEENSPFRIFTELATASSGQRKSQHFSRCSRPQQAQLHSFVVHSKDPLCPSCL